ncbi:hypothetical protein AVEN_85400-1 [Araneus ventricosus]|uniref:Uncharacterized protein n=1 Tax=Araneus ventricosus TaxID=182803 RepID=A0A4Y2TW44_ARAVE|nr:hypothetical protein AVEN_85400-1 [Araneus ventricosus]
MKKLKKLGDFPVETYPHRTLNYSRGIISEKDLLKDSESDIVRELGCYKVIEARRINIKRDGVLIPTHHVILTFSTPELPKAMRAGVLAL